MRAKKLIFYLLACVLGGCIPVMSIHPLYTEKDVVFDTRLLGIWVDDPNSPETTWEFRRPDESKKTYELVFSDEENRKGIFEARLVKLGDLLFLDVCPDRFPSGKKEVDQMKLPYNAFFLVPVHTFIKVNCIEPLSSVKNCVPQDQEIDANSLKTLSIDHDYVLNMQLTDDDDLEKLLKQDPNGIEHEGVETSGIILTASTEKLQAFVTKYGNDRRVFTEPRLLIRKKIEGSTLPEPCQADEPNGSKPKKDE